MAGYFLVGVLTAFGALSVLWSLLGWLLPAGQGCVLVCFGVPDEGIRSRYRWLKGMGLLRCPLIAVSEPVQHNLPDLEICAGEELLSRLEWERNLVNGTGTGDFTGRDQRRGISEL